MPRDAAAKLLIFMHIIKTGGTSLRWALESQFPCRRVLRCYGSLGLDDVERLPDQKKREFLFFASHEGFGVHRLFPQEATYVTMLREPLDRWVSQYYAFIHPYPDQRRRFGQNLGEHIDRIHEFQADIAEVRYLADNVQVRYLAGARDQPSISHQHLEIAKHNLVHHCSAVGITERFVESLALFCRVYGWKKLVLVQRNVSRSRPQRPEISEKQRAALMAHHCLDQELYDFALQQFDAKLREHGVGEADLERITNVSTWDHVSTYATRALRKALRKLYGLG